jgi:tyrosine-protein phosphatase SIW14
METCSRRSHPRHRIRSNKLAMRITPALSFAFAGLSLVAFAKEPPSVHIKSFAQVDEHIYRGAAPSEAGLKELQALHVTIDLDLREPGEAIEQERAEAEKLGIKYINVPMPPLSAPNREEMSQALAVLLAADSGTDRVFVHCRRGRDRTGTVIACFRIQHDGWSSLRAFQEAKQHGISIVERGMRSYILHFHPIAVPATLAAAR